MGVSHVAVQFPMYERLKVWMSEYREFSFSLRMGISLLGDVTAMKKDIWY